MDLSILEIGLSGPDAVVVPVGHLFRYGVDQPHGVIRFVPSAAYAADDDRRVLSLLFQDETAQETRLHLADIAAAEFNGRRQSNTPAPGGGLPPMLLPSWFQNLLPEGAFRTHIAQLRGCAETDYFELLAACGTDLPGAVHARPVHDASTALMQRLVTQDQDALEMSVVEVPLVEGISLSGIQPKLGVDPDGHGRYVARTRLSQATHVVAKLPVVDHPLMPELEHLSMALARLAGVDACETALVPLDRLVAAHHYDLGEPDPATTSFLAVPRYDRRGGARIHAEDFAQALGIQPHDKYSREVSYSLLMKYMLQFDGLGEPAVLELLRRLAVNELVGNPDCHLKNIGVYFPDGRSPALPPAYDIVAHHVYSGALGHALFILPADAHRRLEAAQQEETRLASRRAGGRDPDAAEPPAWPRLLLIRPRTLRALAEEIGLPFKLLQATVGRVVTAAARHWPAAIEASGVTVAQKAKMKALLERHPAVRALRRRAARAS